MPFEPVPQIQVALSYPCRLDADYGHLNLLDNLNVFLLENKINLWYGTVPDYLPTFSSKVVPETVHHDAA